MAARWIPEVKLKEELGAPDAQALMEALGGLEFYVPTTLCSTDILGRDLTAILTRKAHISLINFCGGEVVRLANYRRTSSATEARRMLRAGLSIRMVADALCLSQRYVERLSSEERTEPEQLSLFGL